MSTHIAAKAGEIADKVLLPGDPLRARHIASTYLENVVCYNEVRGMYGFTGTYKGKRVSVQGTGMGTPSLSIYVNELLRFYDAKRLIRVGTCGSMQPDLHIRDVVMAMGACTDSGMIASRMPQGIHYAPTASFELLQAAWQLARERGIQARTGNIFTSDRFYDDESVGKIKRLTDYGILAVEMETAELYTLAARFKAEALTLLTVSDSLVTQEETSAEERQTSFNAMVEIALDIV